MTEKNCSRCKISKDISKFGNDKRRKSGLNPYCKDCRKANYIANRKSILSAQLAYQSSPEGKAKRKIKDATYRKTDKNKQNQAKYIRTKKGRLASREKRARYRALQLQATPLWCEKEKIRFVYKKAQEWGFEVDHVVPLQGENVCGLHCWANLQLLDATLNKSKGNRDYPDH